MVGHKGIVVSDALRKPPHAALAIAGDQAQGSGNAASDWATRCSFISKEFARTLLNDGRLKNQDARSLGAYFLLHAHCVAGAPLADDGNAGPKLGLKPLAWRQARAALENTVPPLLLSENGLLLAVPLSRRPGEPVRKNAGPRKAKERIALVDAPIAAAPVLSAAPLSSTAATAIPEAPASVAARAEPAPAAPTPGVAAASPVVQLADHPGFVRAAPVAPPAPSTVPAGGGQLSLDGFPAPPSPPVAERTAKVAPPKVARDDRVPYVALVALYHEHCKTMARVSAKREWPAARNSALAARWREHPDLDWWQSFFVRVGKSDFLCGRRGDGRWMASFDWIIKHGNLVKIGEGVYDNNRRRGGTSLFNQGFAPQDEGEGCIEVSADAPWLVKEGGER